MSNRSPKTICISCSAIWIQPVRHHLYLMLSSGGITTLDTAARFPVRLIESGPAAGVLAAIFYGNKIGERNLVSFDMGGTTAKMCVIKNGQPTMSDDFEVARVHRFKCLAAACRCGCPPLN